MYITTPASTLANVCLKKAIDLGVDLILLQCTLVYICKNKKEQYTKDDRLAIIYATVQQLEECFKDTHPALDSFTRRSLAHIQTSEMLVNFMVKCRTKDLTSFVREHCKNELSAIEDFLLMSQTGFTETDMLTVLNSYH